MLKKLFSKPRKPLPAGPDGSRAYAIGDVHGRLDLLTELLELIRRDNEGRSPGKVYLVFLGDLIDRGPDSRGVLDKLLNAPPAFARNIFLRGNHEEFFLGVLNGDADILQSWLAYGGAECAESYGVTSGLILNASPSEILERIRANVPRSHADFLESMADSFQFGDYLFVHAGIRPGVPIEDQVGQDLRWIREGFLEDKTDHGVVVVHGHTIVDQAEEHPNRIAVDTGAYRSGKLTAIGIEGTDRWFIESALHSAEEPLQPQLYRAS